MLSSLASKLLSGRQDRIAAQWGGSDLRVDGVKMFGEGFRLIAREPWTVAGWIGLQLGINAVALAIIYGLISTNAKALQTWMEALRNSPQMTLKTMAGGAAFALIGALFGLVMQAVMVNATYRAVLEPSGSRAYARLRLGGRELWMALHLVVYFIQIFAGVGLVIWGVAAGTKQAWLAVLLSPFLTLGVVTLFTLSGPAVFARGGFRLFSEFGPSVENFWALLLCNFLLCLVTLGTWIVSAIAGMVQSVGLSSQMTNAQAGNFDQAVGLMASMVTSPAYLLGIVVNTVIGVLYLTVIIAPAARAYADIHGESGGAAEVFS